MPSRYKKDDEDDSPNGMEVFIIGMTNSTGLDHGQPKREKTGKQEKGQLSERKKDIKDQEDGRNQREAQKERLQNEPRHTPEENKRKPAKPENKARKEAVGALETKALLTPADIDGKLKRIRTDSGEKHHFPQLFRHKVNVVLEDLEQHTDFDNENRTGSSAKKPRTEHVEAMKISPQKVKFEEAMEKVRKVSGINIDCAETILRQMLDHSPGVEFKTIIGQEPAKQALREAIIWPSRHRELFCGITAPQRGILLFGPPGNGKTMLAKAVATECNLTFFPISASSLISKWCGESEKLVVTLFSCAKALQPSVIFIDEVDSLLCARKDDESDHIRKVKTEFLIAMDGVTCKAEDRVLVIGATNLPQDLDIAALRRFPMRILVPMPTKDARVLILQSLLHGRDKKMTNEAYKGIGKLTVGYSGSDLAALAKEAAMRPIRELCIEEEERKLSISELRPVNQNDLKAALSCIRPSVPESMMQKLTEWTEKYASGAQD